MIKLFDGKVSDNLMGGVDVDILTGDGSDGTLVALQVSDMFNGTDVSLPKGSRV